MSAALSAPLRSPCSFPQTEAQVRPEASWWEREEEQTMYNLAGNGKRSLVR